MHSNTPSIGFLALIGSTFAVFVQHPLAEKQHARTKHRPYG